MAGPIRNLISMIRERRQQRLEDGTALFPGLAGRMRGRMGGGFGGNERVRGLMQMRRGRISETAEPEPEVLPTPVDSSGQGAGKFKATSVSTKGGSGAIPVPASTAGDSGIMPDVPDVASLQKDMMSLQKQLSQASVEQVPKIKAQIATLKGLLEYQTIQGELSNKAQRQTFAYNMGEVDKAAKQAVATGQYAPLEALVYGSAAMTPKDSAGNMLADAKPNVRGMVRPHAREYIANTINSRSYGSLTQGERAVLHSAINYAYPVQLVDPSSKKPVTPQQMAAEANRLYGELMVDFPVATPEHRAFLRSLANVTVKQQAAALGVPALQLPSNQ